MFIIAANFSLFIPTVRSTDVDVHIVLEDFYIHAEGDMHRIEIDDKSYITIDSPGDPMLPEKIFEFEVPNSINWSSVQMTVDVIENETLVGPFNISPNPPLAPNFDLIDLTFEFWGLNSNILNNSNLDTYNVNAFYPAAHLELLPYTEKKLLEPDAEFNVYGILPKGSFSQSKCIRLSYRPFLYNPVSKQLQVLKEAKVLITYQLDAGGTTVGEIADYVIITSNQIVENSTELGNFIRHKELYGHDVQVVTEDDFGCLQGQAPNGTADRIRKWLMDNYIPLGIEYVLLIGDPDPDNPDDSSDHVGDIPMKWCMPFSYSWDRRDCPTDYYYADLTGNWDIDGDGYYSELFELWHNRSPDPLIDEDCFTARWNGTIDLTCSSCEEALHIMTIGDVRLQIDDTVLLDTWDDYGDDVTTPRKLTHHTVVFEPRDVTSSGGATGEFTLDFRKTQGDGMIRVYIEKYFEEGWDLLNKWHFGYLSESNPYQGLTVKYYNHQDPFDLSIPPTVTKEKEETINHFWGSGDLALFGPDVGAEVFVGRIPVYDSNYTQLDKILRKIIVYETDPGDVSWRKSILLPMKPLDEWTTCSGLGEGIMNDFAAAAGFDCFRIYEEDYGVSPDLTPCTYDHVLNEWKTGYGIVTWSTHGSPDNAMDVFSSNLCVELNDSMPSFVYQASCLNGYPEQSDNLGYTLLTNGAIATVSGTRITMYTGGDFTSFAPDSCNNPNIAYHYTRRLVQGLPAGAALYLTKADNKGMHVNLLAYNLYGDPDCYLSGRVPNFPPIAQINVSHSALEGSLLNFGWLDSYDPEDGRLECRWDFDNDGTWDSPWITNTEITVPNMWSNEGTYTVKLLVRDELGFLNEAVITIRVENAAPTVDAGSNLIADEGSTVFFSGSFTDPGTSDTHTIEWDFGDGATSYGSLTPTHVYDDNGVYTASLTVTDDDGANDTDSLIVTVVNLDPTATIDALTQPNPEFILPRIHLLTFEGTATDPGFDTFNYQWDFDDGNYASGNIVTHLFSEPGIYTVTLSVTDDDGGVGADSMIIQVISAQTVTYRINHHIQHNLTDADFINSPDDRRLSLQEMLIDDPDSVANLIQLGLYQDAIEKLEMIQDKMDGDKNPKDWITTQDEQQYLCSLIDEMIYCLSTYGEH